MPPYFFVSLGIASGLSMLAAVVLTSLLFRLAPTFIQGLHRLGFMMILAAGAEAAFLLFGAGHDGDGNAAVSRIVLLLAVGLAVYLESSWQINKQRRNAKAADQTQDQ